MQTALFQEDRIGITDATYYLEPLRPGKDAVNLQVTVNHEDSIGLRFLQVRAETSENNGFSLRQCRITLPDTLIQQITHYSQAAFHLADKEYQQEENISITSKSEGVAFPQFSAERIADWAITDFPSALDMQHDGLYSWIYFGREKVFMPKGLTVHGEGILMFADDFVIADNSVFTDRIIILADKNVLVGSHVRLEKALLLCRGKLTIGTDSYINGAVLAQQGLSLGDQTMITLDREVLTPFNSIISY